MIQNQGDQGRIVKTMSDGLLVEFASVVGAVRCAIDVQREWPSATPGCQWTNASRSASAFTRATSSSRRHLRRRGQSGRPPRRRGRAGRHLRQLFDLPYANPSDNANRQRSTQKQAGNPDPCGRWVFGPLRLPSPGWLEWVVRHSRSEPGRELWKVFSGYSRSARQKLVSQHGIFKQ